MENQHRRIRGYRELTQEEIDLMNEVKTKGLELEALINKVKTHISDQRSNITAMTAEGKVSEAIEEKARMDGAEPERWAALGKTNLQEGLMFLTRSIAQPDFF